MPFFSSSERKVRWTKKFAWRPRQSASGKFIWLAWYYIRTIEILRGNSVNIESIGFIYTKNEYLTYILSERS